MKSLLLLIAILFSFKGYSFNESRILIRCFDSQLLISFPSYLLGETGSQDTYGVTVDGLKARYFSSAKRNIIIVNSFGDTEYKIPRDAFSSFPDLESTVDIKFRDPTGWSFNGGSTWRAGFVKTECSLKLRN